MGKLIFLTVLIIMGAAPRAQTTEFAVSQIVNPLAFDFYQAQSKTGDNLVFSPFSVAEALTMASAGAKSATLDQLKTVLHLSSSSPSDFHALLTSLKGAKDVELLIATRLWGQLNTTYQEPFLTLLQENYGSDLKALDFAQQPEAARVEINHWISTQTKEKIRDLLPEGSVGATTDLVLTSALYFNGQWLNPFQKEKTVLGPFYVSGEKGVPTSMMHQLANHGYAETKSFQLLELSYKGSEVAFVVLLPHKELSLRKACAPAQSGRVHGGMEEPQHGRGGGDPPAV